MDEMKKYIIEFSEDPHTIRLMKIKNGDECPITEFKTVEPYTAPDLEQVREKAYVQGLKDGQVVAVANEQNNAFNDGYKKCLKDMEQVRKEAYNKGFQAGSANTSVVLTEGTAKKIRQEGYDKGFSDAMYNCHESCSFLDDAKKEAYQRGYETAKHECEDCPKQAYTDALRMESYQKGLNDAWECARKIALDKEDGGLDTATYCETFGYGKGFGTVLKTFTASEAIEKIRAYEQEKEEQIQVGDEVTTDSGKAVVTGVGPVHFEYIFADGSHGYDEVKNVKKTGRHFPEIAEVLAKMKKMKEERA